MFKQVFDEIGEVRLVRITLYADVVEGYDFGVAGENLLVQR